MQTGVSFGRATIVVPCYNEGRRLDLGAFGEFVTEDMSCELLFVDDGSEDETLALLSVLCARLPKRMGVLRLEVNRGKAEAVRQGLLTALAGGADIVGYLDADLATPLNEMARLLEVLRAGSAHALLGARVGLLGWDIQRKAVRHYLGRIFATVASLVLGVRVYDTQCGAKIFRRTTALEAALRYPFLSRWLFDVELLGRLLTPGNGLPALLPGDIREQPLTVWRDVPGSKLRLRHFIIAAVDMARIAIDLRHRRLGRHATA
jgi:dolichyl-phosphate beta-glucosyltransferase